MHEPGEDTALAGLFVLDEEADRVLRVTRGRKTPAVSWKTRTQLT